MRFEDIPQFTYWGGYSVNISWAYLEKQLASMAEGVNFDMDPDFQRAHVWDRAKQIKYVEYILRGGRAARDILWNASNWQTRQVDTEFGESVLLVDGKQRLEAARSFMRNEIPAFGHLYREFEGGMRFLVGPSFTFHINALKTRAEVLQWYIDLNTGGVVHTEEEIQKVAELLRQETMK